ncbi:ribonuclease H-like domain-containing protein [Mycena metata]|uniref:Ribonuclease H-like domain-containing protein n=1 Tax=Mycena metata TaxID=1033252 RepID=A0AAD7J6W0_9AGAR|nr:ribonuclease H-like domain-containing protein [Mycena metata]
MDPTGKEMLQTPAAATYMGVDSADTMEGFIGSPETSTETVPDAGASYNASTPTSPFISGEHPVGADKEEPEDEGPEQTQADRESLAVSMTAMDRLNIATVTYITSEIQADEELAGIVEGVVGFDTEFVKRVLYGDEAIIDDMPVMGASAKKTARLAIQHLESRLPTFSIHWDKVGLCLVQLAQAERAWVLNMTRIQAFPAELRRIIESPDITKVGAGIISDGVVIWEDLRSNARNLVDVGLITRLWGASRHPEEPYSNLALDKASLEVLDLAIDKTFQTTVNWKMEPNEAHILYAAIDAAVALRVHEALAPNMDEEEADTDTTFSRDWYTFNCTFGEAMRMKRSVRGVEIPWSMKDCTWYANNKFQGHALVASPDFIQAYVVTNPNVRLDTTALSPPEPSTPLVDAVSFSVSPSKYTPPRLMRYRLALPSKTFSFGLGLGLHRFSLSFHYSLHLSNPAASVSSSPLRRRPYYAKQNDVLGLTYLCRKQYSHHSRPLLSPSPPPPPLPLPPPPSSPRMAMAAEDQDTEMDGDLGYTGTQVRGEDGEVQTCNRTTTGIAEDAVAAA